MANINTLLIISIIILLTGSVAECLELMRLIHVLQRTEASRFEPWFGLGSYRWILGEFFIRGLSHGFSPAGPLIQIQTCHPWGSPLDMEYSFRAARGAIHVKQIRILYIIIIIILLIIIK